MAHIAASLPQRRPGDRVAFICNGRQRTNSEVLARVADLAAGLRRITKPGDRVLLAGLNTDYLFEAVLAVTAAGCLACPINWRWSSQEVQHAATLLTPSALIFDSTCSWVHSALSSNHHMASILLAEAQDGTTAPSPVPAGVTTTASMLLEHSGSTLVLQRPKCGTAMVLFTSGTTAAAKGVMVSHDALHVQSLNKIAMLGYNAGDVFLQLAPMFHIGGISSALAMLTIGAQICFVPRYQPTAALCAVAKHRVTTLVAVPTMLVDWALHLPELSPASPPAGQSTNRHSTPGIPSQFPEVTAVLVGAGVLQERTLVRISSAMPNATFYNAYGMTECASSITFCVMRQPSGASSPASPHPGNRGIYGHGSIQRRAAGRPQHSSSAAASWQLPLTPMGTDTTQPRSICQRPTSGSQQGAGQESVVTGGGTAGSCRSSNVCSPWSSGGHSVLHSSHALPVAPAGDVDVAVAGTPVGWAPPGVEVGIMPLDSDSAEACSRVQGSCPAVEVQVTVLPGVKGEIVTRGLHVTSGYWGDSAATGAAITNLGWLRTGDIGAFNSTGCLFLSGRLKDMIKSGGENVHASEVENVLQLLASVQEAAVFATPHDRLGETVTAVIRLQQTDKPPAHPRLLSKQELVDLHTSCLHKGLAAFKVPRVVVASPVPLPRNAMGKVEKQRLKQLVDALVATPVSKL